MKLGDVYKHKENNSLIQVDCFATPMGRSCGKKVVVFNQVEKHRGEFVRLTLGFSGYGSQEEIESEYELFVSSRTIKQEFLNKSPDWNGYI